MSRRGCGYPEVQILEQIQMTSLDGRPFTDVRRGFRAHGRPEIQPICRDRQG